MNPAFFSTIRQHVITLAEEEIISRFEHSKVDFKHDGSIVTETDLAVQHRLQLLLSELTPTIPLLGEEMPAELQKELIASHPEGLWCLDPLDGTNNYASGLPFFAISLALLKNNQAIFGLVYDPMRRECFWAAQGQGAWLNDQPLQCTDNDTTLKQSIAVIDFKRLPKPLSATLVQNPPYASQRSFGSVALDWCWLAANRYHLYLHGQQKAWDYAAGCLILREAGGYSATLTGERVDDGSLTPRSAVASNSSRLFEQWQALLFNS